MLMGSEEQYMEFRRWVELMAGQPLDLVYTGRVSV
jgi:hypothetical protein